MGNGGRFDIVYSSESCLNNMVGRGPEGGGGQLQDKSIFSIFDNVVLNLILNVCCDVIFKLFLFLNRYFQVVLVCIS